MKKQQQIGIKHIAHILGISPSTVSRAFRNTHDVKPETKKKVLELADQLKFTPNPNASALASGSTKTIGVILPSVQNYYFSTVIRGIQEEAFLQGYNVVLYISNDCSTEEKRLLNKISLFSMDGMLVALSSDSQNPEHFENLVAKEFPIVFFDRVPDKIRASRVMQDDYLGAYQATEHLITSGYRRIAHISGPKDLKFSQSRLEGYRKAMEDNGLQINENFIVFSQFSRESGHADTMQLLSGDEWPDAIFAVNDSKAIGAILALKEKKIKVGEEIGVIGFTNDPIGEIIEPRLTTIEEPALEIGRESARLLIKHIRSKTYEIRDVVLGNRLVKRESTVVKKALPETV
jgi:DNA-binding LacI/PurR family transcriptional regulator